MFEPLSGKSQSAPPNPEVSDASQALPDARAHGGDPPRVLAVRQPRLHHPRRPALRHEKPRYPGGPHPGGDTVGIFCRIHGNERKLASAHLDLAYGGYPLFRPESCRTSSDQRPDSHLKRRTPVPGALLHEPSHLVQRGSCGPVRAAPLARGICCLGCRAQGRSEHIFLDAHAATVCLLSETSGGSTLLRHPDGVCGRLDGQTDAGDASRHHALPRLLATAAFPGKSGDARRNRISAAPSCCGNRQHVAGFIAGKASLSGGRGRIFRACHRSSAQGRLCAGPEGVSTAAAALQRALGIPGVPD